MLLMLPFLHIGPLTIASYGTMVLLGILSGVLLIWLRARRHLFPFQDALFAYTYGILGLVIGAKLFYLVHAIPQLVVILSEQAASLDLFIGMLTSGFVFYGGLLGGLAGILIYAKQFGIPFSNLLEIIIPAVPLAHGFGRVGCFMAGCCYGIPYDGPFCVVFELSPVAPLYTSLFPVQLLESMLLFLLTAFLLVFDKYSKKPLSLTGLYLLLYSVIRMVTEVLRGDEIRGSFLFFSTSQWISIALFIVGIIVLIRMKNPRQSRQE